MVTALLQGTTTAAANSRAACSFIGVVPTFAKFEPTRMTHTGLRRDLLRWKTLPPPCRGSRHASGPRPVRGNRKPVGQQHLRLRTSSPGAACYPEREPGKSSSMSAPPLGAGGIAAGARNSGQGQKRLYPNVSIGMDLAIGPAHMLPHQCLPRSWPAAHPAAPSRRQPLASAARCVRSGTPSLRSGSPCAPLSERASAPGRSP
jgi:hypothetical protein